MVDLGAKHLLRLNQTSSNQNTSMCHYTHTILHALVYVFVWLTFPSVVSSPHPALDYLICWHFMSPSQSVSQNDDYLFYFVIFTFANSVKFIISEHKFQLHTKPNKKQKKLNSIELHKILEEVGGVAHLVVYHTFENA